jgi:hypothetical protein
MTDTIRVGILGTGDAGTGDATVPHLPTLIDGLRAQEVVDAARRSEEQRRWVRVR